uniref:C-type lectin domain-containing protein n=1 Tax=Nothobranchius furzeri TaxID=105023 RepID=A0A8C6KHC6_NOTFU
SKHIFLPALSLGGCHRSKQLLKHAVVCLGFLCVVLLAGNIGQFFFCNFNTVSTNLNSNSFYPFVGMLCPKKWTKFKTSCYFVSTERRNWTESRHACVDEGADLMIIDSHEEQVFVNRLLHKDQNAWIGLTDSVEDGVWMWLDGNTVTTTFWQAEQPNNYGGNQDCGELVQTQSGGEWNDDGCFSKQISICEK